VAVFVDELSMWLPKQPRPFHEGSCHLTADSIDELHAFARRIGLRRGWFQDHALAPHYDLTPARRERAIAAGAVFVPARTQARVRIADRAMRSPREA
jgi:hypothetical protein